jgi:parallel beta-helix repeat protein
MVAVSLVGLCVWFTLGVLGSKRRLMFRSPFRLVAVVLAVLVGLVAGCSVDQGEAFDVAVAATVEALRAEVPTVEPAVVEPTVVPTLEPVPTVSVTYDGVYSIEVDGSGDYATIEEALGQVTNGAELRLGAGTFLVTAPLVIDTDIVLTGAGQNSTTIAMGGINDLIISVTEAEVTITDLTTDGGLGVNVNESEIDIQRVTFQRSSLNGLTISNSVGTVTDSISQANLGAGFNWGEQASGMSLVWWEQASGMASNNTTQNNWGKAFQIGSDTGDTELTGNTAQNNAVSGFEIGGSAAPRLTGNTSKDNAGSGFVWFEQASGVASNNTAQNNQGHGFHTSGSAIPELTGNTSKDNGFSGFLSMGSAAVDLTDNTSKDNAQAGFAWFEGASGMASNNTAQNNQLSGFIISGSAAPTLFYNTSKDNAGYGFFWGEQASGLASNNTTQNNKNKAFDNQSSGDLELSNNNEE